jgi:hypothetical protein
VQLNYQRYQHSTSQIKSRSQLIRFLAAHFQHHGNKINYPQPIYVTYVTVRDILSSGFDFQEPSFDAIRYYQSAVQEPWWFTKFMTFKTVQDLQNVQN